MERDFRGAYREFSIETIFAPEHDIARPKIIWRTRAKERNGVPDPQNEELIQIAERGINIVSSRDIRRNVRKSLEIAVDLAAEGKRVLYVNSYAGLTLMREALREQLTRYPHLLQSPDVASEPAPPTSPLLSAAEANIMEPEEEQLQNGLPFKIFDCKMGMWEPCAKAIRRAMEAIEFVPDPNDPDEQIEQKMPALDAIVFNSYEFSAFDYTARVQMSEHLMKWTHKFPVTVVLFTQLCRSSMAAGVPVRGPFGLLTSSAETVALMDAPPARKEDFVHENNPRVHENFPPSKKIKLWYDGAGRLDLVEYPKNYRGHRYDFAFFPLHLMDSVPEGIDAIQVVGIPPVSAYQQ